MICAGIYRAFTRRQARAIGREAALFALPLMCAGCRNSQASPGLEPQTGDYASARQHFETALARHGPAPQPSEALRPPPGAQQVEYTPALHLKAWITPQANGGQTAGAKKPAVLFLHGGFAVGADDWEMTQPYRDAGYIVMMPVLRGENGQSGDYSMFYNEVTDVVAAAEYLARRPGVDAKRLYVAGHSVGGTLTLLAALTWPGFKAATSFSGAPDAIAWSQGQPQVVPFDPKNRREFQMRSPVAWAASFKCPVRIFYGSAEPFFASASQETAARAQQKGRDVKAIQVSGDHFSAVPAEIKQSLQFFKAH